MSAYTLIDLVNIEPQNDPVRLVSSYFAVFMDQKVLTQFDTIG